VRIVGGSDRGRTLESVPGDATRPTADRVRQSLFDLLGQRCDGLAVLDLYAGTGALSCEALSRGAASAVLVESAKAAAGVIAENLSKLEYEGRARLLRDDVVRALGQLAARGETFDLIFSDPPYALRAAQTTADEIARLGLLKPGGRLVLEHGKKEPSPTAPEGWERDERRYGETSVAVLTRPA
jgi:16S rRNA (guanine(966)-N(2))-methyltransferase RsmD